MRVYRYLDEVELACFEKGDLENVGATYPRRVDSNSHRYQSGVKYIHFFRDLDDLQYIRATKRESDSAYFICQFNIDPITLIKNAGVGYYEARGYDMDTAKVREFAIPVSEIKPDNLTFYIRDKDKAITGQEAYSRFESKRCSMPTNKYNLCEQDETIQEEEQEEEQEDVYEEPDLKTKIDSLMKIDDVCF